MTSSRWLITSGVLVVSLVVASTPAFALQPPVPPPALPAAAGPSPGPTGDDVQPPPPPPPTPEAPPPGQPRPTPRPPQAPTPQPARAPQATPPSPPRVEGQPVNIRIDLTISDEGGSTTPVKKTVSMTVGDREFGQIRSEANAAGQIVPLHVDAQPVLTSDGKIRVRLTLNYNVTFASGTRPPTREDMVNSLKTEIREQLGFILENGKPLIVSQSADPIGERRLTVEVKATVLR